MTFRPLVNYVSATAILSSPRGFSPLTHPVETRSSSVGLRQINLAVSQPHSKNGSYDLELKFSNTSSSTVLVVAAAGSVELCTGLRVEAGKTRTLSHSTTMDSVELTVLVSSLDSSSGRFSLTYDCANNSLELN